MSLNVLAEKTNKTAQVLFVEEYTKEAIAHVLPLWMSENGISVQEKTVEDIYQQILELDIEFIDSQTPRFHNVSYQNGKISIVTNLNYAPSYINEYFILRLLDKVSIDIILERAN